MGFEMNGMNARMRMLLAVTVCAVAVTACNTAAKKKVAEQYDSPDEIRRLTPAKMLDIGFQHYKIGDTGKAIDIAKYCSAALRISYGFRDC